MLLPEVNGDGFAQRASRPLDAHLPATIGLRLAVRAMSGAVSREEGHEPLRDRHDQNGISESASLPTEASSISTVFSPRLNDS